MATPPEVIFDRYIRTHLPLAMRKSYKGRLDLDNLPPKFPWLPEMLIGIQESFRHGLREMPAIPEHATYPPFHFDYIDSADVNAMAFQAEGFSFIGITLGLVVKLLKTSIQLADSHYVAQGFLVAIPEPNKRNNTIRFLQSIQLNFVAWHEFTHIVHGHIPDTSTGSIFSDEIGNRGNGTVELQAQEIDADRYSTFRLLSGMLTGSGRDESVHLLDLESARSELQDLTFFAAFILAVGAFFFLRIPEPLDGTGIYRLDHPPPPTRMGYVLDMAIWLAKDRKHITSKMNKDKYQSFMAVIAKAIHGAEGLSNWDAQSNFLRTELGIKYLGRLADAYNNLLLLLSVSKKNP